VKILVVRQDKLGDLILSTPVFEALRQSFPGAHITLWTQPGLEEAVKGNSAINEIAYTEYKPSWTTYLQKGAWLKAQAFDAALLLKPNSGAFTSLAHLAGIPVIVGASDKSYAKHLTHNLWDKLEGRHEVERNLLFAEALGARFENPRLIAPCSEPLCKRQVCCLVGTE